MAGGDDPRRRPSLNWDRVVLVAFVALETVTVVALLIAALVMATH